MKALRYKMMDGPNELIEDFRDIDRCHYSPVVVSRNRFYKIIHNYSTPPYNMDDPNELIEDVSDIDRCLYYPAVGSRHQYNQQQMKMSPVSAQSKVKKKKKKTRGKKISPTEAVEKAPVDNHTLMQRIAMLNVTLKAKTSTKIAALSSTTKSAAKTTTTTAIAEPLFVHPPPPSVNAVMGTDGIGGSSTATMAATGIAASASTSASTRTTTQSKAKKKRKMRGKKILTKAVEKASIDTSLLKQEKGNHNYSTPDVPNELIEDFCDIDRCHYRKYLLPVALELEEQSVDTRNRKKYQTEIKSARSNNDCIISNTRDDDDDIPVTKKRCISTGDDDDVDGNNDDGNDVDGDKDSDVPLMKKRRIDDDDGNDDNANYSADGNGNDVPVTKKRCVDNKTKVAGLKSTGLDYCDHSCEGNDDEYDDDENKDEDGNDSDPHMAYFRRVLDINSTNNATIMSTSSCEQREWVLRVSMQIIEKEFQILNRKAQNFTDEIEKVDDFCQSIIVDSNTTNNTAAANAAAANAAAATTTTANYCKERENVLLVSFPIIQKQIQLLNARAQFFNETLLQDHQHQQIFKEEIEENISKGNG